MDTPVCDFVRRYAEREPLRLHMPGHKGRPRLGPEPLDITEISGADSLYEAAGIIARSEANASALFGSARTFYSAEGSSLCIRAMLYLSVLYAREQGRLPRIWAARNAHRVFILTAALLDIAVEWIFPGASDPLLTCTVDAAALAEKLAAVPEKPTAVYLTSPDYLGCRADVAAISAVCRRYGVLLFVDEAHGAYLKFLPASGHALDLGADLVCDSAHKTLPVLTGGAYLHIARRAPAFFALNARRALACFGSTSPSYLILQSLDLANRYLAEGYRERLAAFTAETEALRRRLTEQGFALKGDEPLKLTLAPRSYGYTGQELAGRLTEAGIEPEFADPDFLVLMLTPEVGAAGLARLEAALRAIPRREPRPGGPPRLIRPFLRLPLREALFAPAETRPAAACIGRILAAPTVSCPPAVPVAVCGEEIDASAVALMQYYGMESCVVVKE